MKAKNILLVIISLVIVLLIVIGVSKNKNYEQTKDASAQENVTFETSVEEGTDDDISSIVPTTIEPTNATEEIEEETVVEETVETEEVIEESVVVEPVEETIENNTTAFYLSDSERRVAECMVMGESGGESYEGQVLVAQCILNACLREGLQPSEIRVEYKYSGWHNNPSESVKSAVSEVFDNGYKVTEENVLYFYNPSLCTSGWHESQTFVVEVGGHRFFKPNE